jgi:hypothetical protein
MRRLGSRGGAVGEILGGSLSCKSAVGTMMVVEVPVAVEDGVELIDALGLRPN